MRVMTAGSRRSCGSPTRYALSLRRIFKIMRHQTPQTRSQHSAGLSRVPCRALPSCVSWRSGHGASQVMEIALVTSQGSADRGGISDARAWDYSTRAVRERSLRASPDR
jgi:hypothetical protein